MNFFIRTPNLTQILNPQEICRDNFYIYIYIYVYIYIVFNIWSRRARTGPEIWTDSCHLDRYSHLHRWWNQLFYIYFDVSGKILKKYLMRISVRMTFFKKNPTLLFLRFSSDRSEKKIINSIFWKKRMAGPVRALLLHIMFIYNFGSIPK